MAFIYPIVKVVLLLAILFTLVCFVETQNSADKSEDSLESQDLDSKETFEEKCPERSNCVQCLTRKDCHFHKALEPYSRHPSICYPEYVPVDLDYFIIRSVYTLQDCWKIRENMTENFDSRLQPNDPEPNPDFFDSYEYINRSGTGLLWEDDHPGLNFTEMPHIENGTSAIDSAYNDEDLLPLEIMLICIASVGVVIFVMIVYMARIYVLRQRHPRRGDSRCIAIQKMRNQV